MITAAPATSPLAASACIAESPSIPGSISPQISEAKELTLTWARIATGRLCPVRLKIQVITKLKPMQNSRNAAARVQLASG
jgi:hypothetical protein